MKTDRELLELAAKAAGYLWSDWTPHRFYGETELREWPYEWNPLIRDSDALELAVKREILTTGYDNFMKFYYEYIALDYPPLAATRRAIVRAAAETEKNKE